MKRSVILIFVFAVFVNSALAQSDAEGAKNDKAMAELQREAACCDSLSNVLDALRRQYAAGETSVANQIIAVEQEAYSAKMRYNKALANRAELEKAMIASLAKGTTVSTEVKSEIVAEQPQVSSNGELANLIANNLFVRNLPQDEYRLLKDAQNKEVIAERAAIRYREEYASLLALQNNYMSAQTEAEAEAVMDQFGVAEAEARKVAEELQQVWSEVYDNKVYVYNLLLEKEHRTDILSGFEQRAADITPIIEENRNRYASDELVDYSLRKGVMTDYEISLATAFGLNRAKDSLMKVKSRLNMTDFRIAKVKLERRYFLEYEPIKVVLPTIYTSRNPIPKTKVYEHGTMYRIRIGIFTNRPNLSALRGITPLSFSTEGHNGKYAYFVGGFPNEKEANEGLAYLKRLGFRDPVVVVWQDGRYYPSLAMWAAEHATEYNVEISGIADLSDEIKIAIRAVAEGGVISRIGTKYVVGRFSDIKVAESIKTAVTAIEKRASVEIVEIKRN